MNRVENITSKTINLRSMLLHSLKRNIFNYVTDINLLT